MFIHTDPSPAHKRNCYLTLDKSIEMDSDLTPKVASAQTVIVISHLFGQSDTSSSIML